jgi:hypothetical protein
MDGITLDKEYEVINSYIIGDIEYYNFNNDSGEDVLVKRLCGSKELFEVV